MNEIAGTTPPEVTNIPIELFRNRGNKTTQLVDNVNTNFSVDGKSRWFDLNFEEPIYVQTIAIETDGYSERDQFTFIFHNLNEENSQERIGNNNGVFSGKINRFCTGFRFKPDSKYTIFQSQSIKKIVVQGYLPEEFIELEKSISLIDEREIEIDEKYQGLSDRQIEAQSKIEELNLAIASLSKNQKDITSEIGETQSQLDSVKSELTTSSSLSSELGSKNEDLESEINRRRENRRSLEDEISINENQLSKIKTEIGLFPSEISGFVQEGSRGIRNYLFYATPFIAIIFYVTYQLFSNAVDLTHVFKNKEINIWAIFLTRLPFVIVAVTILQVCGLVVSRFFNEIIQINKQRLNLSKLSIVAKDVTTASTAELNLDSDQKFHMETHLKMELLREHIKYYLGENYEYQGGRFGKIIQGWQQKKVNDPEVNLETNELPDDIEG